MKGGRGISRVCLKGVQLCDSLNIWMNPKYLDSLDGGLECWIIGGETMNREQQSKCGTMNEGSDIGPPGETSNGFIQIKIPEGKKTVILSGSCPLSQLGARSGRFMGSVVGRDLWSKTGPPDPLKTLNKGI